MIFLVRLQGKFEIDHFSKIFENPIAHRVPICECKLCTKAQLHRILQKRPIRLRSLTKPALSFFYMWDMLIYPYLNKWPFLTAFKTTKWGCAQTDDNIYPIFKANKRFPLCLLLPRKNCGKHARLITHRPIEPQNSHFHDCPELRLVQYFEAEFSIDLKTEPDINYSESVMEHHRNDKIRM